jgi:hypothetical protein
MARFQASPKDQALESPLIIDKRQFLDLVPRQQPHRVVATDSHWTGDQWHRSHHLSHRPCRVCLKAHIAVGDQTEQPHVAVHHGNARDVIAGAHCVCLTDGGIRRDRDRLVDHAGLGALDHIHLVRLILNREIAVDDAEPTLPGNGDRHSSLGHSVHRRGDQRNFHSDALGDAGFGADL